MRGCRSGVPRPLRGGRGGRLDVLFDFRFPLILKYAIMLPESDSEGDVRRVREKAEDLYFDSVLLGLRGVSGGALAALAAVGRGAGLAAGGDPADLIREVAAERGVALGARWASPTAESASALAGRLAAAGVRVVWRDCAGYPARLSSAGRAAAPPWLLVRGRLPGAAASACAVVGSRATSPRLCRAAFALGRELSGSGVAVVSGLARGADQAAHCGAVSAGRTLAVPARGLLAGPLPGAPGWSFAGPGRPDDPFSAGLAVRRNSVIAALGGAVALVASGLQGGSAHAVRYALREGLPLFCFEDGRATPPGNAALLRSGLAEPLALGEAPAAWAESILNARRRAGVRPVQLSLFGEAA